MRPTKPARIVLLAVALGLLAIGGCVAASANVLMRDDATEEQSCRESVRAAEAKVRTDRWEPPAELPDLGDYPEIHWQVRASGDPCSRAPGPTDWAYQGVVVLRPDDARTLASRYAFVPFASVDPATLKHEMRPADVWPGLAPFLPTGARWLHSEAYNDAAASTRWRVAFLDVEHHTMFFLLNDH